MCNKAGAGHMRGVGNAPYILMILWTSPYRLGRVWIFFNRLKHPKKKKNTWKESKHCILDLRSQVHKGPQLLESVKGIVSLKLYLGQNMFIQKLQSYTVAHELENAWLEKKKKSQMHGNVISLFYLHVLLCNFPYCCPWRFIQSSRKTNKETLSDAIY